MNVLRRQDVTSHDLPVVVRGYDKERVDRFLQQVSEAYLLMWHDELQGKLDISESERKQALATRGKCPSARRISTSRYRRSRRHSGGAGKRKEAQGSARKRRGRGAGRGKPLPTPPQTPSRTDTATLLARRDA